MSSADLRGLAVRGQELPGDKVHTKGFFFTLKRSLPPNRGAHCCVLPDPAGQAVLPAELALWTRSSLLISAPQDKGEKPARCSKALCSSLLLLLNAFRKVWHKSWAFGELAAMYVSLGNSNQTRLSLFYTQRSCCARRRQVQEAVTCLPCLWESTSLGWRVLHLCRGWAVQHFAWLLLYCCLAGSLLMTFQRPSF